MLNQFIQHIPYNGLSNGEQLRARAHTHTSTEPQIERMTVISLLQGHGLDQNPLGMLVSGCSVSATAYSCLFELLAPISHILFYFIQCVCDVIQAWDKYSLAWEQRRVCSFVTQSHPWSRTIFSKQLTIQIHKPNAYIQQYSHSGEAKHSLFFCTEDWDCTEYRYRL